MFGVYELPLLWRQAWLEQFRTCRCTWLVYIGNHVTKSSIYLLSCLSCDWAVSSSLKICYKICMMHKMHRSRKELEIFKANLAILMERFKKVSECLN